MEEIVNSRIEPTKEIVEAINGCTNPPALISMSGIGYYGNTTLATNEGSGHGSNFAALVCREWENTAKLASERLGGKASRVVLLRMGPLLDPKEGPLGRMMPFVNMFIGGPLGSGKQYLPWVHRDDAVEAIVWAATNQEADGPYNICAPESVTMKQFAKTLGRVANRPMLLRVPSIVLWLLYGDMSALVYMGQRAVPQRLYGTDFEFKYPSLEGALKDLLGKD